MMKKIFILIVLIFFYNISTYALVTSFIKTVEINGDTAEQAKYFLGVFDTITVSRLQLMNTQKVYWNTGELINLPITVTKSISIDTTLYTLVEVCQMYSVTEDFLKAYNPNATYKTP